MFPPEIDVDAAIAEMEVAGRKLSDLIRSQPPLELLGYVWARLAVNRIAADPGGRDNAPPPGLGGPLSIQTIQLVLEYAHAAWSAFEAVENLEFDEAVCEAIFEAAEELSVATMKYTMWSSIGIKDGEFGEQTGQVDFAAKSDWVLIRGNRYQVLEQEFLAYVLAPHTDALTATYGLSSDEIAVELQNAADAMREGFGRAAQSLAEGMDFAAKYAAGNSMSPEEAAETWQQEYPEIAARTAQAAADMFRGGICNLSKHTNLPVELLEDLAFRQGENVEFYAPGPFAGTPLRTIPARIKPAVWLGDEAYATEPMFVRDAAYRAIQRGLLSRNPAYRPEWNERQKKLTEGAFAEIFQAQLKTATVFNEVYYKDAAGNWAEADGLILIDDALIQVEAKAGIAAMHSPATDLARHVRAIQDLVLKARRQSERFLDYLASAPEVPIFALRAGSYEEVGRLRRSDFRLILPIGLTVEAFTPFSTMCKELPGVTPLLGTYPFISMSIDDLFVLSRSLRTSGELLHYLSVRQVLGGMRHAQIYDETDHLGAYITRNRIDFDLAEKLDGEADRISLDGFSDALDQFYGSEDWDQRVAPHQTFPAELTEVFGALEGTAAPQWLRADSNLRDLDSPTRERLAQFIRQMVEGLANVASRWFLIAGTASLAIWIDRVGSDVSEDYVRLRLTAATLAAGQERTDGVRLTIGDGGRIVRAQHFSLSAPPHGTEARRKLEESAAALRARAKPVDTD